MASIGCLTRRLTALDGLNPWAISTRSWPSRYSVITFSSSSEKRSKDSSALRLFLIFSPHNVSNLSLYADNRLKLVSPSFAAFQPLRQQVSLLLGSCEFPRR